MSFIDNIMQNLGIEGLPEFRATLLGDSACYFENVLSIKSYAQDKIEFLTKGGLVIILGSQLYIKQYCSGDLAVCGKIKTLTRE